MYPKFITNITACIHFTDCFHDIRIRPDLLQYPRSRTSGKFKRELSPKRSSSATCRRGAVDGLDRIRDVPRGGREGAQGPGSVDVPTPSGEVPRRAASVSRPQPFADDVHQPRARGRTRRQADLAIYARGAPRDSAATRKYAASGANNSMIIS